MPPSSMEELRFAFSNPSIGHGESRAQTFLSGECRAQTFRPTSIARFCLAFKCPSAPPARESTALTEVRERADSYFSSDFGTATLVEERVIEPFDHGKARTPQLTGPVSLQDAIHGDEHVKATQRHNQNDCVGNKASPNCQEFKKNLVSALENASTLNKIDDILSALPYIGPLDFESILQALKPPEKITMLFTWMKGKTIKSNKFEVHAVVFRVLGRRQQWAILDCLLEEEASHFQGEAACELFNILFGICSDMGSLRWASKWFKAMINMGVLPDGTTYALVMGLYRRYGRVKEAEFVYRHMVVAETHCLKAYSVMMNLYTQVGQFKKVEQVFAKLNENGMVPEKEHWYFQLAANARQGKVRGAEDIVQNMLASGVTIDIFVYNCMILVNGKAGNYNGATEWFLKVEQDGLVPDAVTYRSMIGACGRAGKLKEALSYYDRMRLLRFRPILSNFNSLIHLHRMVETDGRLLCLLADMREMQCCPGSSTLDAVVKVYERHHRLEKIPQALELLRQAGWVPDEKCYSILIRAYIRGNLVEQALNSFDYLCSRAKLGELLCHNIICMCESLGHYKEALHVFQQMQEIGGIQPSLRTSCTILKIYSLQGAIEKGEALFNKLRVSKEELDSVAYNVVISMYLRGGLPEKAADIVKLVNEHEGFHPDAYLFVSMLKVSSKCGLHQEAVDAYWRMVRAKLSWTESMFNAVIHFCGRALPLEEITKVFQAMVYAKVPINTVTCNVMIDIFGKAGLLENAESVLRMAQKQQSLDPIAFNTIIDAYGKYKEFDKMEAALTQMQNEGFKGSLEAYNSMIDAYGKSGQIGKMENILERMKRAGCAPNMATFNTLINVYGKEGLILDLQNVLTQMEEASLERDSYTYNTLINAYGNAEMPDEAFRAFNEMQNAGFIPDRITYACLISALEKGGRYEEAASWFSKMQEMGISR